MEIREKQRYCEMNMFMFILATFAANGGFRDKWLSIASDSIHEYFSKG